MSIETRRLSKRGAAELREPRGRLGMGDRALTSTRTVFVQPSTARMRTATVCAFLRVRTGELMCLCVRGREKRLCCASCAWKETARGSAQRKREEERDEAPHALCWCGLLLPGPLATDEHSRRERFWDERREGGREREGLVSA